MERFKEKALKLLPRLKHVQIPALKREELNVAAEEASSVPGRDARRAGSCRE